MTGEILHKMKVLLSDMIKLNDGLIKKHGKLLLMTDTATANAQFAVFLATHEFVSHNFTRRDWSNFFLGYNVRSWVSSTHSMLCGIRERELAPAEVCDKRLEQLDGIKELINNLAREKAPKTQLNLFNGPQAAKIEERV